MIDTAINHFKHITEPMVSTEYVVQYLQILKSQQHASFKTHKPFQGENGDWYAIPNEQFDFEVLRHGLAPDHETKMNIEGTWQKLECFDRFNFPFGS